VRRSLRLPVAAFVAALVGVAGSASAAAEPAPMTSGAEALVMDQRTGTVMHAVNANQPRPIASATKLMTALLTLERADLHDTFTAAPYTASSVESKINLIPGEQMKVRDLLKALLLESANDAAVTLAVNIAGSREAFVREMNRRAVELGLNQTSYANPVGFDDPENHSSARDLARLARRLLGDPRFARIVDMPSATLTSGVRTRTIDNRNDLVERYPFVSGVKTGHTMGAGYVLVGAGRAGGAKVISVTLGAPSESARDADTLALLRWGLEQFHRVKVLETGAVLARAEVRYFDHTVALGSPSDVTLLVRRGEKTRTVVDAPDEVEGPLERGEQVGSIEVRRDGRVVRRLPLVTQAPVEGASFPRKLAHNAGLLTALLVLGIVLGAMMALVRRARTR